MFIYINYFVCFAVTSLQAHSGKKRSLSDISVEEIAGVVIVLCALAVLISVAFYILKKLRSSASEAPESNDAILVRFQKMYDRGELTKEEFNSIKELLSHELTGLATVELKTAKNKKYNKNKKAGSNEEDKEEILRKLLEGGFKDH